MSTGLFPNLEAPLEACLFYGLTPPAAEALNPAAWTESAVDEIVQFRLASHALSLIDDHHLRVDDAVRTHLEKALFGQTLNAMRLEGVVVELQEFLRGNGIRAVLTAWVPMAAPPLTRRKPCKANQIMNRHSVLTSVPGAGRISASRSLGKARAYRTGWLQGHKHQADSSVFVILRGLL